MFKRITGEPCIEWYPKKASQAFSNGALVYADGSGAIQPADATSGDHIGIIMKDIVSTDDDYASTTMVPVDVAQDGDEFEVDTDSTATAALVGTYIDLADSLTADEDASAKDVLLVTRFISASKLAVKINSMGANKNVVTS